MAGTVNSAGTISIFVNVAQALANLDKFQKSFDNGISRMRNMVIGFIGAKGLKGYYDSLLSIVDLADRWHLPVEKVSAWNNLLAQVGASSEEAGDALEKLQSAANDLKFHSSGPLRELSAVLNTNLQNKDFVELVESLRAGMKGLNNDAKTEAMRILGANPALQRLLDLSDKDFAAYKKQASQMPTLNGDNAEKLREMRRAIQEIRASLLGVALPLVEAFKPVLDVIKSILNWFNRLDESTRKSIIWTIVGGGFLYKLTRGLLGISKALTAIGVAGGLANPVLLAILGTVTALATIIFALRADLSREMPPIDVKAAKETAPFETGETGLKEMAYGDHKQGLAKWQSFLLRNENRIRAWNKEGFNMIIPNSANMQTSDRRSDGRERSPVKNTTNDNRSMTFNIYGVDGAADLESRLSSIINNNVSPVTGWAK